MVFTPATGRKGGETYMKNERNTNVAETAIASSQHLQSIQDELISALNRKGVEDMAAVITQVEVLMQNPNLLGNRPTTLYQAE